MTAYDDKNANFDIQTNKSLVTIYTINKHVQFSSTFSSELDSTPNILTET